MFSSFSDLNARLGNLTADINISDINQRFSQLASQLSLDNLQTDETLPQTDTNSSNLPNSTKITEPSKVEATADETKSTGISVSPQPKPTRKVKDEKKPDVQVSSDSEDNELLKRDEIIRELKQKVAHFEHEIQSLQNSNSAQRMTDETIIGNLTEQLQSMSQKNAALESQLQEMTSKSSADRSKEQEQQSSAEKMIHTLREQLSMIAHERDEFSRRLEESDAWNADLQRQLSALSTGSSMEESSAARILDLENTIKKLQAEKMSSETAASADRHQMESLAADLANIKSLNEDLQREVDSCRSNASQAIAAATASPSSEEFDRLNAEKAKLKEKLDKSITALKSLKETTTQLKDDLRQSEEARHLSDTKISSLEAERDALLSSMENLKLSKQQSEESLRAQHQNLVDEHHRLQTLYQQQAVAQSSTASELELSYQQRVSSLEAEHQQAISLNEEKEGIIADLKSKLQTLTDKMKDVMKKYAEIKSSKQSSSDEAEAKLHELSQALQLKDGEVMSWRLKYENLQQTIDDEQGKLQELSERYSEVQRENNRLRSSLDSYIHEKEIWLRESQLMKSKYEEVNDKWMALQADHDALTSSNQLLQQQHAQELAIAQAAHQKQMDGMRDQVSALEQAQALQQMKLREDESQAQILEDYKRRAQTALKQANANSTALANEVAELKRALQVADEKADEKEEALALLREEQGNFLQRIDKLAHELQGFKDEQVRLQQQLQQKDEEVLAWQHQHKELEIKLAATATCSSMVPAPPPTVPAKSVDERETRFHVSNPSPNSVESFEEVDMQDIPDFVRHPQPSSSSSHALAPGEGRDSKQQTSVDSFYFNQVSIC
jgi:chromosome segregation ATPase